MRSRLSAALVLSLAACGGDSERVFGAQALEGTAAAGAAGAVSGEPAGRAVEVAWGRLVDVFERVDGALTLVHRDLVVDPALASDGVDYELGHGAGGARLIVLHPAGSEAFHSALTRAADGLERLAAAESTAGAPLVPPELPLDAALAVRFDGVLDAEQLAAGWELTVERAGVPLPVRVALDPSAGAGASRAVVDPLVSRLDGARASDAAALGAVGWPEGVELELRVVHRASGTERAAGFTSSGLGLAAGAPRVVSEQGITVTGFQPLGHGRVRVDYTFDVGACAMRPVPGDLIEFPQAVGEVVSHDAQPGGPGFSVPVFLLAGSTVTTGPARYVAPFEPAVDRSECFVSFSPAPAAPPAAGVSAQASVSVRFDRPMDPASFEAFRTLTLARGWSAPALEQLVVGQVVPSASLERFTFVPSLPLSTVAPISPAAYDLDLDGSPGGVLGLDGTPLDADFPTVSFALAAGQATSSTSGIVLAFDQVDEDGNGWPELRGQFVLDPAAEEIRPRPVQRFSSAVDASQTMVGAMIPFQTGVQTPLSPFGSRASAVWRYFDLGFGLLDENYHNLDVEGLWWAPRAGQLAADQFDEFEMVLGHAGFLPDEAIDQSLLPKFALSGLATSFDQNHLDPAQSAVVHPKAQGYTVDPLDLAVTSSGTPIAPWPMNQGVSSSQYTYWTWRDTAVLGVGAPNGVGADPSRATEVFGSAGTVQGLYARDEVPTIGLPLLTEFRTWPGSQAAGQNALSIALAINSSALPSFRVFSTGGVLASGAVKLVDPDSEPTATGGINPITGGPTAPRDNAFHLGQADFVVRVSRAHSVWFDTGAAGGAPVFGAPVVEPASQHWPAGTQVTLAFRGADSIASAVPDVWETTRWIDPYGDSYDAAQIIKLGGAVSPDESFQVSYLNGDPTWKTDPADLDGARFVQLRLTLVSNAETAALPTVQGLGVAFER